MSDRGGFLVMAERCNECLYGENKIVSDRRRKQILLETAGKDRHFVCHKASMVGQDACCRGDWDARQGGQLGRIASRLNVVRFITEADLKEPMKKATDSQLSAIEAILSEEPKS